MKGILNIKLISIILLFFGSVTLTSCLDEIIYVDNVIGEGEANVRTTLTFNPMEVGLDTRSSGTAVNRFNEVCVIIYTSDGKFFKKFMANSESDYNYTQSGNTVYPDDSPTGSAGNDPDAGYDHNSEAATPQATFSLKNLPYGKYRIYAVANLGMLPDEVTDSEEALKGYRVGWNENVSRNNSMFGFFTLAGERKSAGFDAPDLIINKPVIDLHCWIKRTVSKVTIAFDPSGLKESVTIYIRSVTIHDIPNECRIGKDNKPTSDSELTADGETIYFGDGKDHASNYDGWLKLQKGSGVKGSKDHLETDEALYFYENMQGDYEGKRDFLKQQIKEETGSSINEPEKDENGNILENEDGNMKTDFKDRVRYGSYIEVEGYYVSHNTQKLSRGPIKYRFMLGQNTTYNYNAQRNCHYKLTLKFRGWANQPDWHIVYDELTPSIIVPDPYYISYLYNQNMVYPVRLTGIDYIRKNKLHLHAQIIKNNWYPTIEKTGALAPEIIGTYDDINGLAWNKWAYEHTFAGANYAGFLSLRENKQAIVGEDQQYGEAGNEYLLKNYEGKINVTPRYYADYDIMESGTGFGVSGSSGDGLYDVVDTDEQSVTVNLPMYTRPKELIPASDFTGNNPFQGYVREATVRFSLRKEGAPNPDTSTAEGWLDDDYNEWFKVKDNQGKEKDVKYVDVKIIQVPRVVNPKGIWRRWDSQEEFYVELKQLKSTGSTQFENIESAGQWRASILVDPNGLIKLYSSDGQEVTNQSKDKKYIEGSTGTEVKFWYKPNGTAGSSTSARCGIILVEYHDYTCNHLIFVRQGYDKGMKLGNASWSCYNAVSASGTKTDGNPEDLTTTNVVVTNSPLSIGSFFKRCQYSYAILEKNDQSYGWLKSVTDAYLETAYTNGTGYSTRSRKWSNIGGFAWTQYDNHNSSRYDKSWAETWKAVNRNNKDLGVPTLAQYESLRDNSEYGYGVVYADGAKKVAETVTEAYGYTNYDNKSGSDADSEKGMRACILYNRNNGDQILFPIGALGQGKRARSTTALTYRSAYNGTQLTSFSDPGAGALTYCGIRGLLYSGARNEFGRCNNDRPLTYNVYRNPGSIYWFKQPGERSNALTEDHRTASWDINYANVVFNPNDYGSLGDRTYNEKTEVWTDLNFGTSTDALPIKFIYKNDDE